MSDRSYRPSFVVRALVAVAVVGSSLATATAAEAGTVDDLACAVGSLTAPVRLDAALDSGVSAALVRVRNALTADELDHLVEDDSVWIDRCAQVFVVDEAAPEGERVVADAAPQQGVPDDVLDLSSRPGSARTIYLDFDGSTEAGTRWRSGEQIVSPAYSIDADRTTLSDVERAQVHLAWRVVSEDYAPFDVNVTTREPAASALTRSSATDPTYGMHVVVTPTNSVGAGCGCGGSAYVGVFGNPGGNNAQPAFIFTNGAGTGGDNLGQVISHEVGHTFGLSHDGTATSDYHVGAKGWAPIMGASYNRRASHWSSGEYAGADNVEDDVAIIARTAPLLADDHAGTRTGATRISTGTTTAGLITSRTDTDAFTFTADGPTTLEVAGPDGFSNLDVRLTVLDPLGRTVATVDPVADVASDQSMAATWAADLAPGSVTYTAVVDGVGHGDPAEPGRYSDYGSIGTYTVALRDGLPTPTANNPAPDPTQLPTQPPTQAPAPTPTPTSTPAPAQPTGQAPATAPSTPAPSPGTPAATHAGTGAAIGFATTSLPRARHGRKYHAEIRFTGPVSEARVDWRLPQGLTWRVVGDRIVITGTVRKRTVGRFATVLTAGDTSVRRQFRLVVR
ncbi:zinc-dependent metalloprotease family protein [Nocardioides sp. S-58]|uniref:Zinc-dependent metalloprotease family protein n=1 Tax=Nocardioides renjunii TaxID=3095075 RepID=A0ABU5KBJ6_9ACTN|nr:M12 family metallo-peptidase [Nocardioides sp. S-58]MDZ5661794.1 zinc-dependent metalloprotease family protein [Nocardioides sp. S-58]